MRQATRSFFVASAAVLPTLMGGAAAHALTQEAGRAQAGVPACVEVAPSWRYTFVTNNCSAPYTLTIAYSDGREVPCRVAHPGNHITFPGYGTRGDHVVGAVLCSDGADH